MPPPRVPPAQYQRPVPIPAPRPPARPPEPRSPLGALTFGASLLVLAAAVLLDRVGFFSVSAPAALSTALAVTAAGLIAGIWYGRARGVIAWGVVLSLGVIASSAVGPLDVPFTAGIGEKHRTPLTVAEVDSPYELTIGELEVDLSQLQGLDPRQPLEVEINLGIGQATVWVPEDVTLHIEATTGVGSVQVLGKTDEGIGNDFSTVVRGAEGSATISLDISAGMGEVIVQQRSETP